MVISTIKEYVYFYLPVTGTCKELDNPDLFRIPKLYNDIIQWFAESKSQFYELVLRYHTVHEEWPVQTKVTQLTSVVFNIKMYKTVNVLG